MMESIRKWFYRPKKDDKSLLAQFFYADEALNLIASELDSFDGRKDPERCTSLVNQLRQSQDRVLTITNAIMDVLIAEERANRDFRVKFPEDVLQENLAGQLWFGAECLAAGSSIMNRESESAEMRPLAKALTKSLENVRNLLREACLRNNTPNGPLRLNNNEVITEILLESLKIFDRLFAEFELCYVSAMVPVKSTQEYELQELIGVLFSETLQRALQMKLLTQEMVDDYDPALMFTIPRLAIVSGLLVFPNGPLSIDKPMEEMSEMFRPFRTLLHKIRELLWTLNKRELYMLEKLLCDNEQLSGDLKIVNLGNGEGNGDLDAFVDRFYTDYPNCKDFVSSFYTVSVAGKAGESGADDAEPVDEAKEKEAPPPLVPNCSRTAQSVFAEVSRSSSRSSASADDDKDVCWQSCDNEAYESCERKMSQNIEIPSTSGYLIANAVTHDSLVTSVVSDPTETEAKVESLPDHDCLEVISVAAATLSSILLDKNDLQTDLPLCMQHTAANPSECGTRTRGATGYISSGGGDDDDSEEATSCAQKTLVDKRSKLVNKHHDTAADSLDSPDDSGICTENTSLDRSPSLDLQQSSAATAGPQPQQQTAQGSGAAHQVPSTCKCSQEQQQHQGHSSQNTTNGSARHKCTYNCSNGDFLSGSSSSNSSCSNGNVATNISETSTSAISAGTSSQYHPSAGSKSALVSTATSAGNCNSMVPSGGGGNRLSGSRKFGGGKCVAGGGSSSVGLSLSTKESRCDLDEQDTASIESSDTSSFNSNCADDEEIALAMQAAEIASRNEVRAKFRSSEDLVHRLFVCIAGVADQLQTNFASDLRNILKAVFLINASDTQSQADSQSIVSNVMDQSSMEYHPTENEVIENNEFSVDPNILAQEALFDSNVYFHLEQEGEPVGGEGCYTNGMLHGAPDSEYTNYPRTLPDGHHLHGHHVNGLAHELNRYATLREEIVTLHSSLAANQAQQQGNYHHQQPPPVGGSPGAPHTRHHHNNHHHHPAHHASNPELDVRPPVWIPDVEAPKCMSCSANFTVVKRRHHCRNCGKVFCARCSSNSVPLPKFGHYKPVRVCNKCFMYHLTPFTM